VHIELKMKELGMPVECPSCGSKLIWKSVDLACVNPDCETKQVKEVASFIVKCGVENATEKSLTNWGITNFTNLFTFRPDPTSKSATNFEDELKKNVFSKSMEELFACLSFDGAGSTNINKIIDFYGEGSLIIATKVLRAANELFFEMNGYPEGIGQKVIDKIKDDWNKNLYVVKMVLNDSRYNPKPKAAVATGKLTGASFVLTGSFPDGKKELEKMIVAAGGTIASSVSKTLKFLVCAPDSWGSSSKYTKAEKLAKDGVKIVTEAQLREML